MTEKKPILFGPLPPPYGGVSIFMHSLAAHAAAEGFRVWSYKGAPGSAGISVNHRRFGHLAALWREGRGARIVDSTHFHLEYPNRILLPSWITAKKLLGFTWIKILHDGSLPDRYEKFGSSERWLIRRAIENIDEFVVTGEELEPWLRNEIGFTRKISFIRPLLPTASNVVPMSDDLKEKLARFSHFSKRVCSVGIFIPSYGFHEVADAVEKLRNESGEKIGLFLVDGGFEANQDFRNRVVRDRDWIVVAKDIPHPNLAEIFRISDVFVRGFAHESYGLSRIEALLSGTPVIATNVGETRGMSVYEFGDETALISRLKDCLFGQPDNSDAEHWIGVFRAEAGRNLDRYKQLIMGGKQT